jgi:PTS system ascorbate-specific IIC component
MIAVILSVTGMGTVPLVLFGGLALGLYPKFPVCPKATVSFFVIWRVNGCAIAGKIVLAKPNAKPPNLGHTGNFGYALSGLIGKFVGNKEKSTEDINFPKGSGS